MWVEFVVGSLLCSERFFSPGTPVFPSPEKPTFPNSNSIQISVDEYFSHSVEIPLQIAILFTVQTMCPIVQFYLTYVHFILPLHSSQEWPNC